jgi:hypothetical protein
MEFYVPTLRFLMKKIGLGFDVDFNLKGFSMWYLNIGSL